MHFQEIQTFIKSHTDKEYNEGDGPEVMITLENCREYKGKMIKLNPDYLVLKRERDHFSFCMIRFDSINCIEFDF